MIEKKQVLFVCLGNIVRSPLAEALFLQQVEKAGLEEKYGGASAGTSAYHVGESPDKRMRQVAAENGLVYDGRSRQVQPKDFDEYDLLIAMDSSNYAKLIRMTKSPVKQAKVHLLRAYDPEGMEDDSVPDPYYGGIEGFHSTYAIVERSVRGLLSALEEGVVD